MTSLKELRKRTKELNQTMAKSAKTAKSDTNISQISHFSQGQHCDQQHELQFLRDERAAIREYDGGMTRERAEYYSVLDIPSLPGK